MNSLESRFQFFMKDLPSAECIDDLELEELNGSPKADYLGLGRRIVFELKSVTKDQTQKVQAYIEQFQDEEWYPLFFGQRDINQVLKYFPDPEDAKRQIITKCSKLVEDYFKKGNKQISSTKRVLTLENAYGVLVILNDSVPILSPDLLAHRARDRLLQSKENGVQRFDSIDMVIVISETHLLRDSNPIILQVEGKNELPEDIAEYLRYVLTAWGHFNGGRIEFLKEDEFEWEEIKEKLQIPRGPVKRHEARSRWYHENPYLRQLTDEKVLEFGARVFELTAPFLLKGGLKAPANATGEMTLAFGDFVSEVNFRGLDMKDFERLVNRGSIDRHLETKFK